MSCFAFHSIAISHISLCKFTLWIFAVIFFLLYFFLLFHCYWMSCYFDTVCQKAKWWFSSENCNVSFIANAAETLITCISLCITGTATDHKSLADNNNKKKKNYESALPIRIFVFGIRNIHITISAVFSEVFSFFIHFWMDDYNCILSCTLHTHI